MPDGSCGHQSHVSMAQRGNYKAACHEGTVKRQLRLYVGERRTGTEVSRGYDAPVHASVGKREEQQGGANSEIQPPASGGWEVLFMDEMCGAWRPGFSERWSTARTNDDHVGKSSAIGVMRGEAGDMEDRSNCLGLSGNVFDETRLLCGHRTSLTQ